MWLKIKVVKFKALSLLYTLHLYSLIKSVSVLYLKSRLTQMKSLGFLSHTLFVFSVWGKVIYLFMIHMTGLDHSWISFVPRKLVKILWNHLNVAVKNKFVLSGSCMRPILYLHLQVLPLPVEVQSCSCRLITVPAVLCDKMITFKCEC